MSSYLRNWLPNGISAIPISTDNLSMPIAAKVSPPLSNASDGTEMEGDHSDDDSPPAFPSISSAQRISSSSGIPRILLDSQLMPPPPNPRLAKREPGVPAEASSSLAVPYTTVKPPSELSNSKKRGKVALAPGHSPLDWAALKTSGTDLRGVDTLLRIPPSVLKTHNTRDDAWSSINGKVYNITPYLAFHPGGEKELMRVAGRDGTKLFGLTHAWVNVDFMLDACLVGFLVGEPSS